MKKPHRILGTTKECEIEEEEAKELYQTIFLESKGEHKESYEK